MGCPGDEFHPVWDGLFYTDDLDAVLILEVQLSDALTYDTLRRYPIHDAVPLGQGNVINDVGIVDPLGKAKDVKAEPVSATTKPVTHVAEVAVKMASWKGRDPAAVVAAGIIKRIVPINIRSAKLRSTSLAGDTKRMRNQDVSGM